MYHGKHVSNVMCSCDDYCSMYIMDHVNYVMFFALYRLHYQLQIDTTIKWCSEELLFNIDAICLC